MSVITIARQFGAGGKTLGDLVAKRLGYTLVDEEIVELIAQEANVGTGTIYRYFKNKEDLIDELYKHLKLQMAQAVLEKFPAGQIAIGPPIADGFYYDFAREEPFTEDDLATIEKKIHRAPNRTRHAMNGALIAIGVLRLPERAPPWLANMATWLGLVVIIYGVVAIGADAESLPGGTVAPSLVLAGLTVGGEGDLACEGFEVAMKPYFGSMAG